MIACRLVPCLFLVMLGAGCLLFFAGAAPAADASAAALQANIIYELAADRSRMIQISLVFVALSCALIWWYR